MTYSYLLDTNIISNLVRQPTGPVFQQLAKTGDASVCTSIIVACELYFGAQKSGSMRLRQQLTLILQRLPILPIEPPVEIYYAQIRTHLEQAGTPIGPNDLLIAAHALALGLTVVTANQREFLRVLSLSVENWL